MPSEEALPLGHEFIPHGEGGFCTATGDKCHHHDAGGWSDCRQPKAAHERRGTVPSDEALRASREWFAGTRKVAEASDLESAVAAVGKAEYDLAEIIDRHTRQRSWREAFDAGARAMRVKAAYLARQSGFSDGSRGTIEGQIASAIVDLPLPPHPDGPPERDLAALLVQAAEMIEGGRQRVGLPARLRKAAEEIR